MGKKVGAEYLGDEKCSFCLWAPQAKVVEVVFEGRSETLVLTRNSQGYWSGTGTGIPPGTRYKIRLDQKSDLPDPASLAQPEGVHSWSQVIDQNSYNWEDNSWKGRDIKDMVIYEIHVGTFTPEGTFEAVIDKLDHLEELGINTLEIMPIAQFPGTRNWGYDGVYPFAAQWSYGGPEGLKKLVDSCHQRGFSILLDVVYNHLGPEGNYISEFGPYFTEKYHTPWGSAINFDDQYADQVRNHFLQNAMMWLEDFHFDGLRLDAIHEIIDRSAHHLLQELSERTDALEQKTGRKYSLIAESDLNDSRIVSDYARGGYGLEAQWVDDFHHAVHTVLTGEDSGYYSDYGKMEYLEKTFKQAFIYDGLYSPFRKRSIGNKPNGLEPSKFVVCIQNHDQVGNRPLGERLSELVSFEKQKLAAATLLTAPFVPMLFMGEEFGEPNRFQYFVDHGDEDLVKAVQEGRKKEFEYFFNDHQGEFPDPQSEKTFNNSKLNWNFQKESNQHYLFQFYKELLKLRKEGQFEILRDTGVQAKGDEQSRVLIVSKKDKTASFTSIYNFGSSPYIQEFSAHTPPRIIISSADPRWGGKHTPEELIRDRSIEVPADAVLIYRS